ncbi:hypothetical protein CEXT_271371 [Caerostris extrusa]|uniref:Uncharacterized protein n=1 Tax=Caerostris extrusa TaxID=172846 RepID=A0AAV4U1U6_CAEEX|nr:hypothetical protein CEXT_271371 [Caerostris extrusa]
MELVASQGLKAITQHQPRCLLRALQLAQHLKGWGRFGPGVGGEIGHSVVGECALHLRCRESCDFFRRQEFHIIGKLLCPCPCRVDGPQKRMDQVLSTLERIDFHFRPERNISIFLKF